MALIELLVTVGKVYRDNPQVRSNIGSGNTTAILDAFQMHQVDLGIVGREANHKGVEKLFQTSTPYICLLPEDHPLADRMGVIDLEGLASS